MKCRDCGCEFTWEEDLVEPICVDCENNYYADDDGQPDEYQEWQDYMGGDDWDHGQYDEVY